MERIRANVLLRFQVPEREAAFKHSFQCTLPRYLVGYMALAWLNFFVAALPRYITESRKNGFVWAREDPRTLFYSATATCVLFMSVLTVTTGLAVTQKLPPRINIEAVAVVCLSVILAAMPYVNFIRVAALYDTHPSRVFGSTPTGIDCFCGAEVISVLQIDAFVTGMNLFLPLRCCLMWIPCALSLTSYAFILIYSGAADMNGSSGDNKHVIVLCFSTLVLLAWLGAWRNEKGAREKWLSLNQSEQMLQEQKSDLLHLEAKLQGMHSLMNTVCDVVFCAGHDLQVCHKNTALDEILGPMKGRYLSDMMADDVQCERFHRVVSSLFASETSVSQRPTTVLVPPVKFARQNPVEPAVGGCEGFEAEILVADTGMWHGSGSAGEFSWRYLVGLKGLTQSSFLQTEVAAVTGTPGSEVAAVTDRMHSRVEMQVGADSQTASSGVFDIPQPIQTSDNGDSLTNSSPKSQKKQKRSKPSRPSTVDMGMLYLGHTQSRMATVPEQIPLAVGVPHVLIEGSIWPVWASEMTCHAIAVCLEDLMVQVPCSTRACCLWHSALSQVEQGVTILKRHRGMRCHPTWKPNDAWQCIQCGSLAEDVQDADCLGCGASGQAGHRRYPAIGKTVIPL